MWFIVFIAYVTLFICAQALHLVKVRMYANNNNIL